MGLANRLVEPGQALSASIELAQQLAKFPQLCMRSDRLSSYRQWDLDWQAALELEMQLGLETVRSGETLEGAQRFSDGAGRHGRF
jgi:enoyl-CoA hydratase